MAQIFIYPGKQLETGNHHLRIIDSHGSYTNPEFLLLHKQSNIQLLFSPRYSSHVLQPSDLVFFTPPKSSYLYQMTELAHLDNATTVMKQRFVYCYYLF